MKKIKFTFTFIRTDKGFSKEFHLLPTVEYTKIKAVRFHTLRIAWIIWLLCITIDNTHKNENNNK